MPDSSVPISSPCLSLRPSTWHSPEWLVGAWQHESHGATEICGEVSVEGNLDMHFGNMPFVGLQGNAGLPSSWWMIKRRFFLVACHSVGNWVTTWSIYPDRSFIRLLGPRTFAGECPLIAHEKPRTGSSKMGFGKNHHHNMSFRENGILNPKKADFQFSDLVVGAGISPAQWRTVANALWCVLHLDLLATEAWEHVQCNSCVQMSGNVWKRETW